MATRKPRKHFRLQDPEAALMFEIAVKALELGMKKSGPEAIKCCNVSDVLVDLAFELEERRAVKYA